MKWLWHPSKKSFTQDKELQERLPVGALARCWLLDSMYQSGRQAEKVLALFNDSLGAIHGPNEIAQS
ncbi:MAG TPA: hypothetical protein VFK06_10120 [Candidatus Angelobacter sp.]|nr:hypothetical protein [Candidatus Angelobacter sp.]